MIQIAFHSNQLSMTGTEVALFDYARYNEEILGNKSIILHNQNNKNNHPEIINKFRNRFEVFSYNDQSNIDEILKNTASNLFYAIKSGRIDGLISTHVPTMVHAVFPTSPQQIHGASYAFISNWLSLNCSHGKIPAVPHIVAMPNIQNNWRARLSIPQSALVLGGYGGKDSFNVPCAIDAVRELLHKNMNIYFLFMNFTSFIDHPRAIFLPGTSDIIAKTEFINTCNAMLHARLQGESFGLACGEFSVRNKPVITYEFGKHSYHIEILGSNGLLYKDKTSLIEIINRLPELLANNKKWDSYTPLCNPESVMADFDRHLIYPALQNPRRDRPEISVGWRETIDYWRFKWRMHH